MKHGLVHQVWVVPLYKLWPYVQCNCRSSLGFCQLIIIPDRDLQPWRVIHLPFNSAYRVWRRKLYNCGARWKVLWWDHLCPLQLLCGGRVFIYVYTTNLLNNEVKPNAGNVLFMFVFRTALRGRGLLLDHQLTYHHFPDSGYKPAMQLQDFFGSRLATIWCTNEAHTTMQQQQPPAGTYTIVCTLWNPLSCLLYVSMVQYQASPFYI